MFACLDDYFKTFCIIGLLLLLANQKFINLNDILFSLLLPSE